MFKFLKFNFVSEDNVVYSRKRTLQITDRSTTSYGPSGHRFACDSVADCPARQTWSLFFIVLLVFSVIILYHRRHSLPCVQHRQCHRLLAQQGVCNARNRPRSPKSMALVSVWPRCATVPNWLYYRSYCIITCCQSWLKNRRVLWNQFFLCKIEISFLFFVLTNCLFAIVILTQSLIGCLIITWSRGKLISFFRKKKTFFL